ncbi:NAD(P)-dependent dehydrogenase (short-subunit alcohol dehydrogenase family) [Microbacterium sp. AK009]|uniref:SDR family NAD(P)-dependent oxidoreductase n=1 Tax=Microbacterium sp. AK009 TaxID=2723068 RepID=UPI00179D0325|nr:SDR family oxidoreductase [Microbacterium sp. AK009]NYF18213.1 NAD(P)-dependent dehydrogenase (short-subunit alcohol dehydrogenase family) [Microbacterium sp. AK009]
MTGGGRGLGRGIAEALAARDFHVVVTHRPGSAGAAAVLRAIRHRGGTADSIPLDLTEAAPFTAFRERLVTLLSDGDTPRLDVLINNAGVGVFRALDELTPEDYEESFAVNIRGPLFLTQALADLMPPGASVVNVSTQMTRQADPTSLLYSASKAALESLTGTLAMALGPRGIRVNSIAPGPTATDFNGGAMRDSEALREYISSRTAFGRVGTPDDIALAVAGLLHPDMAWITGQRIEAAGGAFL